MNTLQWAGIILTAWLVTIGLILAFVRGATKGRDSHYVGLSCGFQTCDLSLMDQHIRKYHLNGEAYDLCAAECSDDVAEERT